MTETAASSGVRQVDQQHQTSVVVLTEDGTEADLVGTLIGLVEGTSALIVVDCVEITRLRDADYEAIVTTSKALRPSRRRLLVLNASPEDLERLRRHAIDVYATSDSAFPDDVDDWLEGLDLEQ
jgi:hypothetical protein